MSTSASREKVLAAFRQKDWPKGIALCRAELLTASTDEAAWLKSRLALALELNLDRTTNDIVEAIGLDEELLESASAAESLALHRRLAELYVALAAVEPTPDNMLSHAMTHYERSLESWIDDPVLGASIAVRFADAFLRSGRIEYSRAEQLEQHLLRARQVFELSELADERDEVERALAALEVKIRQSVSETSSILDFASSGRRDILKARLASGVNLEERDDEGCTALHRSVGEGNVATAQLLIENGASLNARDNQGFTPLHWAVFSDDSRLLSLTLDESTGVSPTDTTHRTPLTWAVSLEKKTAIDWLIQHGADIAIADDDGWTPLHYAAATGDADIVSRLLRAGANVQARSSEHETAEDVARRLGHTALLPLLTFTGPVTM